MQLQRQRLNRHTLRLDRLDLLQRREQSADERIVLSLFDRLEFLNRLASERERPRTPQIPPHELNPAVRVRCVAQIGQRARARIIQMLPE